MGDNTTPGIQYYAQYNILYKNINDIGLVGLHPVCPFVVLVVGDMRAGIISSNRVAL